MTTAILALVFLGLLFGVSKTEAQTAPTITSPPNVQTNQAAGDCSQSVAFAPTATGDPAPTVVCELDGVPITSPYSFPVGVSTVVCTAANSAGTQSSSFTVTVLELNPPIAGANALGTFQGESNSVSVAKVLGHDHARNGGTLSISDVTSPTLSGATVTMANGLITYVPPRLFVGMDTINYTLSDGCGTTNGTIDVTVLSTSLPGKNSLSIVTTPTTTTVIFAGVPGATYLIKSALLCQGPWVDLSGPLTAAANGLIQYTDTTFPKPSSRFYQIFYVSGP